jgi:hypothetical protein
MTDTKVRLHFLNFLNRSSKNSDFLKDGTFDVNPIFMIEKIRSMTAANFCLCRSFDLISIYFCFEDFADFSYPYRSSTHQTLSV